jgi:transposase InsO family protein
MNSAIAIAPRKDDFIGIDGVCNHAQRRGRFRVSVAADLARRLSRSAISASSRKSMKLCSVSTALVASAAIHRRGPWRSFEAVEMATLEWVDWFNNRRLLEPIGNISPAEAEAHYYAQFEELAMVA